MQIYGKTKAFLFFLQKYVISPFYSVGIFQIVIYAKNSMAVAKLG